MALATDLLDQARLLAKHDRKRPRQANLRRAVSSAYYALFHLLIHDAVRTLTPARPELRRALTRAFSHATMVDACRSLTDPNGKLARLCGQGVPSALTNVAAAFIELQQARHEADYDIGRPFSRSEVHALVALATKAHADWRTVRKSQVAAVFVVGLLEVRNLRS